MERFWTKHYDQGVPADLQLTPRTLVQLLDDAAAQWPDWPSLTFGATTLTYRELREQVARFAAGLSRLGVGKDSRVGLWLPNLPQMVIAFFAALRLGAQVTCANPRCVEREIAHQLGDAGVTVLVMLEQLLPRLRNARSRTAVERAIITSGSERLQPERGRTRVAAREPWVEVFEELLAAAPPEAPTVDCSLDHLAVLQYTGGTTGAAKGVMLTHRNLSANAQQIRTWFQSCKDGREVVLGCLPYFHSFGMTMALLVPVLTGARIVLIPDAREVPALVKSIATHRVTLLPAEPMTYAAINEHLSRHPNDLGPADHGHLKVCLSGSAPLSAEVRDRFARLTGCLIVEGYGMSETSPVTHAQPLDGVHKPGSVGLPLPGTEMKVVDVERGELELGVGQEGELCIAGPQVMAGYWRRPEETARALRFGWLHTGDVVRVDEDGYTFVVSRKKDMIISGGQHVYPDEVDAVLGAHPAVLESATIGVPDARRGGVVKSFIVLRPGATATAEEIEAYCREELSSFKVPKLIEFVASLPKSSLKKILRRELRAREQDWPTGPFPLQAPEPKQPGVEILFEREQAPRVKERTFSSGQRLEELPDGRVRLTLQAAEVQDVLFWLIGYTGGFEVVGPAELRDAVRARAQAAVSKHTPR